MGAFWKTALVVVSLVGITLLLRENRIAHFIAEERAFHDIRRKLVALNGRVPGARAETA